MNRQSFYVGVKALIAYEGGVLILKDKPRGKWELPGGRIDENQTIEETLQRELDEELSGAKLQSIGNILHAAVGDFTVENNHKLCLVFYDSRVSIPATFKLSDEHTDTQVVTAENIKDFDMFTTNRAALQKYFDQRGK